MPLSQFTSVKLLPADEARNGPRQLTASGPLEQIDLEQYAPPFVIHFTIVQSATEDHNPDTARRASGFTVAQSGGDWEGTADVIPSEHDTGEFEPGKPARGIGVAILPRRKGFAYETLTWCDHIVLGE